ncbi:Other/CAMKK/ELM protein kinase [Mycena kentingensis (nom. inval.)]|nr:Other/CAMKK/ELM protein kinase [Mycena kentingensis (nom. inval.)]
MASASPLPHSDGAGAAIFTIRQLARGHNGTVSLVQYNSEPGYYAMKKIPRNDKKMENMLRLRANNPARNGGAPLPRTSGPTPLVDRRGTEEAKIAREIAIMKKCDHPNIVKLRAFIDDPREDCVRLVLEYMEGGELQWRERDSDTPYLNLDQTRRVMRDVVLGIEYLHMQGIIHRDIKPSNIMWNADRSQAKIGDFGTALLASSDDSESPKHDGTPPFMAPEICPGGDEPMGALTIAVDLWALGVTLYALIFGSLPFNPTITDAGETSARQSLFRSIREDPWTEGPFITSQRLAITPADRAQGGVLDLVTGLLTKEVDWRFTISIVKSSAWLFAGHQQWVQATLPHIHPPLVLPPEIDDPTTRKISVSKHDKATAIMETKFSWPLALGLRQRVSNLFGSAKPDQKQFRPVSEPERLPQPKVKDKERGKEKGKGKDRERVLPLAETSRPRGFFGTWRSAKGRANAARHSVEALGNTRVAATSTVPSPVELNAAGSAFGGVVVGSGSGAVTVLSAGSHVGRRRGLTPEQRAKSLSNPQVVARWESGAGATAGGGGDELYSDDGEAEGREVGLIVVPRGLDAESSLESYDGNEAYVYGDEGEHGGPDESDSGDEDGDDNDLPRPKMYDTTSSGEESGGSPVEFKRRVRPNPRGPGHGG